MTRERAAVTEGLSATLALVGFLAGMHTLVDGQGRSLDELFPTSRVIANVGTDSAVNALCSNIVSKQASSQLTWVVTHHGAQDRSAWQSPSHMSGRGTPLGVVAEERE